MDVTITNLSDLINAIIAAFEEHALALTTTLTDITNQVIGLALVLLIVVLAYWHRDMWLYILAGMASITFAATYITTDLYIGLLFILFGVYQFFKAALDRRRG